MDDDLRKQKARDISRRIARLQESISEWKRKIEGDVKMLGILEEALKFTLETEREFNSLSEG